MKSCAAFLTTLFSVVSVFGGCHSDSGEQPPEEPFVANCKVKPLADEAKRTAGKLADGSYLVPGGHRLTPAGRLLDLGGFPNAMRVLAGDRFVVVTDAAADDQALRVVDLMSADPRAAVVQKIDYPYDGSGVHSPGLNYGLALTRDGKRLYVSNGGHDPAPGKEDPTHYNTIEVFDVVDMAGVPHLALAGAIKVPYAPSGRAPSGMTLSSDEKLLYVACEGDNTLAIFDLGPPGSKPEAAVEIGRAGLPGFGAYDVAVDEPTHTAFVSLWGGSQTGKGKYIDGVVPVDVANPRAPIAAMQPIATGKAAEAELLLAGKLYVANADAETISIVDTASRAVRSIPVTAAMIVGASPESLAVDLKAGGMGRLYVANAGENSVVALDLGTLSVIGRVPTAYYPTSVVVTGDGSLVIASARGLGIGPTTEDLGRAGYEQGVVQVIAPGDLTPERLKDGDAAVQKNLTRPRDLEAKLDCPADTAPRFPVPVDGKPSGAIKHVYLIVKENKTYDALLGDLAGANGDPKLVMFGENNTPNLHALARGFVNLDNFYSHAQQSTQGHQWTTASISNDYIEKTWATLSTDREYRPIDVVGPGQHANLGMPGGGAIWHHLDRLAIPYKNYGELTNIEAAKVNPDPRYPGLIFNLEVSDVDRANYLVEQLNDAEVTQPAFSYILMPVDHTYGTSTGRPTPQSMVADNDEGVGLFVEGLSQSRWWKESIVFIVEDDPQDGGDHVEGHRSIGVVVSPWVKRGYVGSANTDLASIYRTLELILGMGPMNVNDATAGALHDCFTDQPDFTPYSHIPRRIPPGKNAADAPLADESNRIDFTRPDTAPLGRILWKATHGPGAEPPWRRLGAPPPRVVDEDD